MRCEGIGGQPVNEALSTAGQLLIVRFRTRPI